MGPKVSVRTPSLQPSISVALVRSLPRSAGRTEADGRLKLPGPGFSPPPGFLFGSGGDCVFANIPGQTIKASSKTVRPFTAVRALQ